METKLKYQGWSCTYSSGFKFLADFKCCCNWEHMLPPRESTFQFFLDFSEHIFWNLKNKNWTKILALSLTLAGGLCEEHFCSRRPIFKFSHIAENSLHYDGTDSSVSSFFKHFFRTDWKWTGIPTQAKFRFHGKGTYRIQPQSGL